MFRYLQFYVACAVVLGASIYWPLKDASDKMDLALSGETLIHQQLKREAALVSYFCLSDIPPAPGKAVVPSFWEEALDSEIQLRENIGSIQGIDAFAERKSDVTALKAGESAYAHVLDQHLVVYRPPESPRWFLAVSKIDEHLAPEVPAMPVSPLASALAAGLVGALILTLIARFVIGSQSTRQTTIPPPA